MLDVQLADRRAQQLVVADRDHRQVGADQQLEAGARQDLAVQAVLVGGDGEAAGLGLDLGEGQRGEPAVQGHRGEQLVRTRVVHLRALPADRDPGVADLVEDRAGPAGRAAGDDDVQRPGGRGGRQGGEGALGDGLRRGQQSAVQVGGDQPVGQVATGGDGVGACGAHGPCVSRELPVVRVPRR